MKHAPLIACLPILLLAACGRTEPVADMPSQEELAAAANAAAANAISNQQADETPDSRNYVNLDRGFSVTLPEGWVMDKGASNDDGVVCKAPSDVGWGKRVKVHLREILQE